MKYLFTLFTLVTFLLLTSCTQDTINDLGNQSASLDENLKQNALKLENKIYNESTNITVTEPLVIEEWNSIIELHVQSSKDQDVTDLYESPISTINLEISGMFKLHEND